MEGEYKGPIAGEDDSLEKDLFDHEVKKVFESSSDSEKDYLGISKSSPEEVTISEKFDRKVKPLEKKLKELKLRLDQESNVSKTYSSQSDSINSQIDRIKKSKLNKEIDRVQLFIKDYNFRLDNIKAILDERDVVTKRLKKEINLMQQEMDAAYSACTLGHAADLQ